MRRTSTRRCSMPPRRRCNCLAPNMLTITRSASCRPSSAPQGASTLNFFVCSACTLIGTASAAQANHVCPNHEAFFAAIKIKVRRMPAKAAALRISHNLAPIVSCSMRPSARKSRASLLHVLELNNTSCPRMAPECARFIFLCSSPSPLTGFIPSLR
jgi:hypothetical protein